tara:strand:- start:68 stop:319 length:252 start_codon:yes stop_codon:yes gene_type:complete
MIWLAAIFFGQPYHFNEAIEYLIIMSVIILIVFPFYLRKRWDDDFIFLLLKRIAFSLGILKERTKEKIKKTKDKMREDMGEWY